MLRRRQILQAVLAEIAQSLRSREGSGCRRDDHLAPVPATRDTSRAVHVHADIPPVSQMRSAGVDAHAHPDPSRRQPGQRVRRGRQRPRRRREGDEKGVPLRVNLEPAVPPEGLPQDPAVLRQRAGIALRTQLVQQLGRALDVRKEKGDGAAGEIAHNTQGRAFLAQTPAAQAGRSSSTAEEANTSAACRRASSSCSREPSWASCSERARARPKTADTNRGAFTPRAACRTP